MTTHVPLATIMDAGERAARYRRHLAAGRDHPFVLEQDIIFAPVPGPIVIHPDGWARIGTVADSPWYLAVWWHRATNRVQVERPECPP